jgi:hypothetical protein
MKLTSVFVQYPGEEILYYGTYVFTKPDKAHKILTSVLNEKKDSDIFLFPGGLFTFSSDAHKNFSRLEDIVSRHKGKLIVVGTDCQGGMPWYDGLRNPNPDIEVISAASVFNPLRSTIVKSSHPVFYGSSSYRGTEWENDFRYHASIDKNLCMNREFSFKGKDILVAVCGDPIGCKYRIDKNSVLHNLYGDDRKAFFNHFKGKSFDLALDTVHYRMKREFTLARKLSALAKDYAFCFHYKKESEITPDVSSMKGNLEKKDGYITADYVLP